MGNQNEIYRRRRHENPIQRSQSVRPASKGQNGKDPLSNEPTKAFDRAISGPVTALAPDDILSLQRTTSNRVVQQLIARRKQSGYSNGNMVFTNHKSTAVLQRESTKKKELIDKGILVPTLQFPRNKPLAVPETPKKEPEVIKPVVKPLEKPQDKQPIKPEVKPKPEDKIPTKPKTKPPIPASTPMAIITGKTHLRKPNKNQTAPNKFLGITSKIGDALKEGDMVVLLEKQPSKDQPGWQLAEHPKTKEKGFLNLSKTITHLVTTPASAFALRESLRARGGYRMHEGGLDVGEEALESSDESVKTFGSVAESMEEGTDTVKKFVSPKEWMTSDEWNIAKDTEPFKSQEEKPDRAKDTFGLAGSIIGSFSGIISVVAGFVKWYKDGKITWDNAEKTVLRIMEGTFKTITGIAKTAITVAKWAGSKVTEIAGQCLDAVKGLLDGIVGIFKAVINAAKGKKWEVFKEVTGTLMNFGKGAVSAVQFGISVAEKAAASIPFAGSLLQALGGVLNVVQAIVDIALRSVNINKSEKDVENKKKDMLHVKDKNLFAKKLANAGLADQVKGMDNASDIADVVRQANPEKLKTPQAKKDLQELKEWALDLQLVEIGTKRQRKGIYSVIGKAADIASGIFSIIGGIGAFIAEVIGPATAGIGFAVGKAMSLAGGILNTAIKIGQLIVTAIHGAGLKIRQWGRDIAAKTGVGKKIFNVKKSTTEKKRRRVQDAITLFKNITSIPIPNPKRHTPQEMKELKPRWENANMRITMTGVDVDKLKKLDGKPNEQIAEVANAMAERGD